MNEFTSRYLLRPRYFCVPFLNLVCDVPSFYFFFSLLVSALQPCNMYNCYINAEFSMEILISEHKLLMVKKYTM